MTESQIRREIRRAARNLRAAQDRAEYIGTGAYGESYAQAAARSRRNEATIRKHTQRIARLERQLDRFA